MTRIAFLSGSPALADSLKSMLRRTDEFQLLPACQTVGDLMDQLEQGGVGVALLDLTPEVSYAAISQMRRTAPKLKIILWANSISTELALRAMELGVRGILRKSLPAELQVRCLRRVEADELWFEQALACPKAEAARVSLIPAEAQLIALLAHGLKNSEIAGTLAVPEADLRERLASLYRKVGVRGRFELALFGLKNLEALQPRLAGAEAAVLEPVPEQMRLPLFAAPR